MPRRKSSVEARAAMRGSASGVSRALKTSPVRRKRSESSSGQAGRRRRSSTGGSGGSGRGGGRDEGSKGSHARRRAADTPVPASTSYGSAGKLGVSSPFSFRRVSEQTPRVHLLLGVPTLRALAADVVLARRLDTSGLPRDLCDYLTASRVPKSLEARFRVGAGRLSYVYAVAVLDEDRVCVAVNQFVQVWHWRSSECLVSMSGHRGDVLCLAGMRDARHVVSGGMDHGARVWDCSTGKSVARLDGHFDKVYCVAVTLQGDSVITGSYDHVLRVWDWRAQRCRGVLRGHKGAVRALLTLEDGEHVVSGGYDWTIRVWSLSQLSLLRVLSTSEPVTSLASLGNDRHVLATCENEVSLWDWRRDSLDRKLREHRDLVIGIAGFQDGVHAVSCSSDGSARVWDCLRGVCKAELSPHSNQVNAVCVWQDPHDRRRYVATVDEADVRIWS